MHTEPPMRTEPNGPLAGCRVLDLSGVGPGSRCTRILSDLGASVTKIEPTTASSATRIAVPYWAYGAGRGTRRVRINLKDERGRDAFLALAAGADVVIEGSRPGVATRLGIDYEAVRARNPRIVYCSVTGYGQSGPAAQWAGHDVNYVGLAGMLGPTQRRADGAPALPGLAVADSAGGGMQAALAVLAALVQRSSTGRGAFLDVSLAEGVLYLMAFHVDQYLATEDEPAPGTATVTGRYAFYDFYQARDGKWLAVGAVEAHFYANLCRELGCEQWIAHQLDDDVQNQIRAAFREAFATRDRDDWVAHLAPRNTCVGPAYTIAEVVDDPHFAERAAFVRAQHPEHGEFRQVAPLLAGADRSVEVFTLAAEEHTDTEAVLTAAGMTEPEIAALREAGAVE